MLTNRLLALWAARGGRGAALTPPEPRLSGDVGAGRRLLAGQVRLGARVVEAPGASIWDLSPGDPEADDLHGFAWLDDLAALGTAGRPRAQGWTADWIDRFGGGRGVGWTPERAGPRTLRLTGHAAFLLRAPPGAEPRLARSLAPSLAAHAAFLRRRWRAAPPGLPRLWALAGLLEADLALGRPPLLAPLAQEAVVDAEGCVPSRAPEDLLDAIVLLQGIAAALSARGIAVPPAVAAAIARAAPRLRALRHADGGLARFHGGDRGPEGRLDGALAAAGRPSMTGGRPALSAGAAPLHMGFARLAAGRVTVIVDAGPPPPGAFAQASTLAFEMTAGRRPLVVGGGPGGGFGPDLARAARATASQSTLGLDGFSSSRLVEGGPPDASLADPPRRVIAEATPLTSGLRLELAHDGWRASHGLTHARILDLAADGRSLAGEDVLTTLTAADRVLFDGRLDEAARLGLGFAVRFHLHPDVEAEEGEASATLSLPSGEAWRFSVDGDCALAVAPSTYLERGGPWPRPAFQVVLRARALSYATRLRWRLDRVPGAEGLRDLDREGS